MSAPSPPLAFRPHPWHGLDPGSDCPRVVTVYVELVPTDGVKYEIDKHSGYLRIDRPQRFSVACPTLYGFVPRTYCGESFYKSIEILSNLSNNIERAFILQIIYSAVTYAENNHYANLLKVWVDNIYIKKVVKSNKF